MTIREVAIDRTDGDQTRLDGDVRIFASDGTPMRLDQVADSLVDPGAWIEYETEVQWQPNEDLEPWQETREEPWRHARTRIYARAVVSVMVIYEEGAAASA